MAYHNNTPKSVLDAPGLSRVMVVEHTAPNRWNRRHARTATGGWVFIPKQYQAPAFNEPYRRVH